mgnify:CR=1 FL=1
MLVNCIAKTLDNKYGEVSCSMAKKALIVRGGWDGHQPIEVSELFREILENEGFQVEISETLDAFLDVEKLKALDLIIPIWTMGKITHEQVMPVLEAVASGVGLAGCHGGMCDAFRECVHWQFMTGGQWVAHPGGVIDYRVNVTRPDDEVMAGITDFDYRSEQYYMHVDPSNEVLATTTFTGEHAPWIDGVVMPVVWKRRHGKGRVFYSSLGHAATEFENRDMATILRRGINWAAREE